jgi:hypothetical protein
MQPDRVSAEANKSAERKCVIATSIYRGRHKQTQLRIAQPVVLARQPPPGRTAMVRMAEAGATTAQIAAVSGHTIDQTSRILDTHIPRRGEVAAGAIDAWERGKVRSAVVHMTTVDATTSDNSKARKSAKSLK